MHSFDAAIALNPAGEHRFSGATSPAYANMVGPFGGATAAVLLNSAMQHPARLGDPIALTVNFASALADGAFEIEARPVRTNRSTQHWAMQLTQGGAVTTTATAVFALRRETWSTPEALPPTNVPRPEAVPPRSAVPRLAWIQRYDMRFVQGGPPTTGDAEGATEPDDSRTVLWVRDEPPRPLDFASLTAISDCFFPRIFVRRRKNTPIGTVSMTTYFHADSAMLALHGERPLLGTARALNYRNGFFDQSAELWNDAGQQLVSTHQIVYFRE